VGVTVVHVVVIGGGGGGSRDFSSSGPYWQYKGGQGGQVSVFRDVPVSGDVAVTIGAGGAPHVNGTGSSFGALSAEGGYGGMAGDGLVFNDSCVGWFWRADGTPVGAAGSGIWRSNTTPPANPTYQNGNLGPSVNGTNYGNGGRSIAGTWGNEVGTQPSNTYGTGGQAITTQVNYYGQNGAVMIYSEQV
jgi:hypothetical protein